MKRINFNGWALLSTLFILMILMPIMDVMIHLFQEPNETWYHIKEFLLADYVKNTVLISGITAVLTMIIGTSLAWLIAAYDFPLRKFFRWALILPLAIPPYIAAYTYAGILSYTGPVQVFFRNTLGLELSQKYFDVMSVQGVIFIFTIFLLPYVYMVVRTYLEKQSSSLVENARLLGKNGYEIFFKVVIPISRGVIVAGVTLVILEVVSDYGVVSYFGIKTFSTAIFSAWFSMGDVDSAIRLAAILMLTVFVVMTAEKSFRGRRRYTSTSSKIRPIAKKKLKGILGMAASLYCGVILVLGFVIPTVQLLKWSMMSYEKILNKSFFILIYNSVWIALIAGVIAMIMAVIIANYTRISESNLSKIYSKITLLGYSIPGAVVAITVILFFVDLDNRLVWFYKLIDVNSPKLVLSMSIWMLVFAYVIRFLAVGYQSVEGGFEKAGKKFYEASRLLGKSSTKTFFLVDLPMIKPTILSGFALVFVDIVKELPLALILRPFNFHTLATKVFEYANNEMIIEAAVPSMIIIGVTLVAIFIINKALDREVEA
ncbi:MAG: iron ABC transporter permease [Proteocatella sp.]